jgi:pectate lyase
MPAAYGAVASRSRTITLLIAAISVLSLLAAGSCSSSNRSQPSGRAVAVLPPVPDEQPVGFGQAATGGKGGSQAYVTSLDDSGPGTLRDLAEKAGASDIKFRVSGVINLDSPILVASDKTVDGSAADVTITQKGLTLSGVTNVVIRNLKFAHIRGKGFDDEIQVVENTKDIWIDHCSFSDGDDGLVDITRGATRVTVSWSKFYRHDKVMLISGELSTTKPMVTLHHNFFVDTVERNPLLTQAWAHAYNNYLSNWATYGMKANEESQLLSEANIFEAGLSKKAILVKAPRLGEVRSIRDLKLNGAEIIQRNPNQVFDPRQFYGYSVERADSALRKEIELYAGWQPPALFTAGRR